MIPFANIAIDSPYWAESFMQREHGYATDSEKMRLVIALAQENVAHNTGGPFGAAIFSRKTGTLVAIGTNSVLRLNNSVLHAEIMAIMAAEARLGSYTLRCIDTSGYELFTSCEPCAMCLGAILWSGVTRVVSGAMREDAICLGFDEGPVFAASLTYLEARGVEIVRGVLRDEAKAVLDRYSAEEGVIYNG